jgi:ATP-dependent DNA ligase
VTLPLPTNYAPMEAKLVAELPAGGEWQYEPKFDGFRCLAFKDGDEVDLRSKSGQPFNRYFPEVVAALAKIPAQRFVLDGELVVPEGDALSFEHLLMRIHPAASRVEKLALERPALFVVFDLLVDDEGKALVERPLAERREMLERYANRYLHRNPLFRLAP